MSFLAPGFLWAGFAAAVAVVALHLIVTRQPRSSVLPTARFVPDAPATALTRTVYPSDPLLMLVRILAVLLVAAGMARPVAEQDRRPVARVFLVDASRSVASVAEVADSVARLHTPGDVVIAFDSAARTLRASALDSIRALRTTIRAGDLSAALIAGLRAASTLRESADSLELVIVSPFAAGAWNLATDTIRSLWPGRARAVRVAARIDSSAGARRITFRGAADDPLRAAHLLASRRMSDGGGAAEVVRAGADAGADPRPPVPQLPEIRRGIVYWPQSLRPRFTVQRARADTVGALILTHASWSQNATNDTGFQPVVTALFARRWVFPQDSLRGLSVVARWMDGEPAAVQSRTGDHCFRSVAIDVPRAGDLVIRQDFVNAYVALTGPCTGVTSELQSPARIAALAGTGALAGRTAFLPQRTTESPFSPWLLGAGLLLLLAELLVRQRRNEQSAGAGAQAVRRAA